MLLRAEPITMSKSQVLNTLSATSLGLCHFFITQAAAMGDGLQQLSTMFGAIAPVFMIIALGRIISWKQFISTTGIAELTKLLYWVCLPALLIDRLGRELPPAGSVLKASTIGIITCVAAVVIVALLVKQKPGPEQGSIINGGFRMNGAFVGLPIIALLSATNEVGYTDLSSRYLVMMAVLIPFTNALAVIAFLMPGKGVSMQSMRNCGIELLRNPIILASLFGVAIGATIGNGLAESPVGSALSFLGDASIPLALLLAGASLDIGLLRRRFGLLLNLSVIKLVLVPAFGFLLCLWWGLDQATTLALCVLLGSPTAVSAVPMARALGGDEKLLSAIVVATTLFSPFTLLAWLLLAS